ncbi:hypothetical protein OG777_26885 [Micromonospora peucetia]|uniref:Uncharacterized protein n=1 Tax=Micromonospora peucetia TaxID=47871 RepID=A0A1C6W452_9ACTN|nr:hypothetical protein [Micromonospora peucetia]MCX4390528.1 hypothetical protein [Micromonospora peucetia]SCL72970.1 hypothetical protein GA0070608_5276 [Micromonospora peucetia]
MSTGPPLTEVELVSAWDRALGQPAARRPLLLLGREDADRLPVGEVAAMLLRTARDWAGGRVEAVLDCPACPERLEVGFAVADLLAAAPDWPHEPGPTGDEPGAATFTLRWRGHRLTLRLPTPADLEGAARAGDAAAAERWLLRACLLAADPPLDNPVAALPEVSAAMAERDPLGVVAVGLTCPGCGTATEALLDLPAWAWQAVDARVRRLLGEVHRLARAYGWSEAQVLGLGPHRRAAYLEQVP